MVKLKNPLISFNARGKSGGILFKRRRGLNTAEKIPVIPDLKSPAQLAWRTMFEKCVDLWHGLSAAEKAEWESLAGPRHMTGYAWYLSQCLRPNPGIYLPLAGGTMQGLIRMDGYEIHGLPAPVHASDATRKSFVDGRIAAHAALPNVHHTPPDIGEGHITLFGWNYNSIGQGTWAFAPGPCTYYAAWTNGATHADGDNYTNKVYLAAGTYTLRLMYQDGADLGILDMDLDTVEVASKDCYAAAAHSNIMGTTTGIVVATSGLKDFRCRLHGKNPASSNFYTGIQGITIWRTA